MKKYLWIFIAVLAFSSLLFALNLKGTELKLILEQTRAKNLSLLEAKYWQSIGKGIVQCGLCPRRCVIADGQRGACGVRLNHKGKLFVLTYGKVIALHNDPIEKKPFAHFLPGSYSLSLATAGCNLRCLFCQNWQISQAAPEEAQTMALDPQKIVKTAQEYKIGSIAYTYTEPTIFYEFMYDTAKLARKAGLKNVYHSCGYIHPEPLKALLKYMDAANIDLKGFTEEFYQQYCSGSLQPVLDSLQVIKKSGVWLEITHLVIPNKNDDPEIFRKMCQWIKANLGADVPLHLSAFHPAYLMQDTPPTSVETLEKFYGIAKETGLNYVYIGNVYGNTKESTFCPQCKKLLIKRSGYEITENNIVGGKCKYCGYKIAGVWK
ncbi:MAG: AmmeMemoRadiSam system radical SAM enzyme [Candidatus Margulisiibacteriota bacterium]|jgi:pyruvate formate lyase activating enzyme